jgi:hypothetical protein
VLYESTYYLLTKLFSQLGTRTYCEILFATIAGRRRGLNIYRLARAWSMAHVDGWASRHIDWNCKLNRISHTTSATYKYQSFKDNISARRAGHGHYWRRANTEGRARYCEVWSMSEYGGCSPSRDLPFRLVEHFCSGQLCPPTSSSMSHADSL